MPPLRAEAWLVLGTALAFALGLRWLAARGPLWFDEVWTLALLERLPGLARLLGAAAHDNLHPVQVLWLSLVGRDASSIVQRLPAILSGTACVWLAWRALARHDRIAALVAALFFAAAFPLVQYGSEARGYAPMLACALIAFERLDSFLTGNARALNGFRIAAALGPLCHLTFVLVLAGLGLWALARRIGPGTLARLFWPAALVLALQGAIAVTAGMQVGGAEAGDWAGALLAFIALGFGVDAARPLWPALVILAVLAGAVALAPRPLRLPLALLVLVLPLLVVLSPLIAYPQPRYYLAPLAFGLLALALALGRLARQGWPGRIGAGLAVAVILAGSLVLDSRFLALGRGDAAAAARTMGQGRVATNRPFRVMMQLEQEAPGRFVLDEAQPDWFIAEQPDNRTPEGRILHGDRIFALVRVFPHWGLSGFTWALYRATDDSLWPDAL